MPKDPLFEELDRLGALYIKAKYRERRYGEIASQLSEKIVQIINEINQHRKKPMTSWEVLMVPDVDKDKALHNQAIRYVPKGTRENITGWGKDALKAMLEYYAVDPDIVSTQLEYIEEQQLPSLLEMYNVDIRVYRSILQMKTLTAKIERLEELFKDIPEKEKKILIAISNFGPILKRILQQIIDKQPVKDLAFQTKGRKDYIAWKEK